MSVWICGCSTRVFSTNHYIIVLIVLQKDLASAMFGLGAVGGALEIYQRLEMWEEVAVCYQAAGRRGKAEEVIREQLKVHRTPAMLCLLGDVTQVSPGQFAG